MNHPQWKWTQPPDPEQRGHVTKLVCVGSTYELGIVTKQETKSKIPSYTAFTLMVEGVFEFSSLKEAQEWVERTCRIEFGKLKEAVE